LAPVDFFFISQTEINFERTTISDDSRDYGKFADGARRDPEIGVPGLFPEVARLLGACCIMQEGSTLKAIRLTQFQACPKKL
jgi:hypothetical protein